MDKRTGFFMKESPLTLLGTEIKVGDKAPEFNVVTKDLEPYELSIDDGKVKIIVVVPSLDTRVCELETIQFNSEADKLGDGVQILTISVDLPFAQQRFCGDKGINNIKVLSDYQNLDFGYKYGVVMEGLKLLNRSIFVLDKDNTVKYVEYVSQNTDFPNFEETLKVARELI